MANTPIEDKITAKESSGYFLGGVSAMLANKPIASYLLIFFTNCLLLDPAKAGAIFMFGRIFDGLAGILFSNFMDKTNTKWGAYRPYLLFLSIPLGISFVLCFSVPGFAVTQGQKFAWAAFAYVLSQTILKTMTSLAYNSLPSLVTRDGVGRAKLASMLTVGNKVADLCVSAFTMTIILKFGGTNEPKAWLYMAMLYGILIPLGFLACFATIKEKYPVAPKGGKPLPMKTRIQTLKGNTVFFGLVANTAVSMLVAVPGAMFFSYFVMYNLGRPELVATLMTIAGVAGIAGGFLLAPLTKRFEKRHLFVIASACIIIGSLAVRIMPNIPCALIFIVLLTLGGSLNSGSIMSIVPDAANYGEWKNNVSSPALLYSIISFLLGGVSGVASYIVGAVLEGAGYDGAAAVQTEPVMAAILNWMTISSIVMAVIAIAVSFTLKDSDRARSAKIAEELAERNKK